MSTRSRSPGAAEASAAASAPGRAAPATEQDQFGNAALQDWMFGDQRQGTDGWAAEEGLGAGPFLSGLPQLPECKRPNQQDCNVVIERDANGNPLRTARPERPPLDRGVDSSKQVVLPDGQVVKAEPGEADVRDVTVRPPNRVVLPPGPPGQEPPLRPGESRVERLAGKAWAKVRKWFGADEGEIPQGPTTEIGVRG